MTIEQDVGFLTGSIQLRWNQVLSPVVFVLHNREQLQSVAIVSENRGFKFLLSNPRLAEVMAEHMPGDKFGNFLETYIPEQATKKIDTLTETVLNSALVFGHAVLEDVVLQTLRLCLKVSPDYFYDQVCEKSIKVKDVRSGNFQSVLDAKVEDWFKVIDRETLLSKMKALFACVKPSGDKILEGYSYSEQRLEEIDNLRHEVVHKKPSRSVVYGDLEYLRQTTVYAAGLLQVTVGTSVKSMFDALKIAYSVQEIIVGGPNDTGESK